MKLNWEEAMAKHDDLAITANLGINYMELTCRLQG